MKKTFTLWSGNQCIPYQCPDESHAHATEVPEDMLHRKGTPCPFAKGAFPRGLRSCCTLNASPLIGELLAFGQKKLADRVWSEKTCEETLELGRDLARALRLLEVKYRHRKTKPHGEGHGGTYDEKQQEWEHERYSTFDEAMARIREGAEWHETLGRQGYGVLIW